MSKTDIKSFSLEELKKVISDLEEPVYRARQIFSWLFQKGAGDFNEMTNIPARLKEKLRENYYVGNLELSKHLKSADGTKKFLFKLLDEKFIETVVIYAKDRKTICLSTQVGCKFSCAFCASGYRGFVRNLTTSEITGQILFLEHTLKHKITNYVFMGMGEPLDNFENVSQAIIIMNNPDGMNIGARRITISTCGIIPGIEKLKELGLQINLSISLHAANNKLRDELMPVNRRYPLEKLIRACERYIGKAGRIITLEYILIRDKNDSLQDGESLAGIANRLKAKVNLILCSPVSHSDFEPPQEKEIELFMKALTERGVNVTLRESKGKDIHAACGQLAG